MGERESGKWREAERAHVGSISKKDRKRERMRERERERQTKLF